MRLDREKMVDDMAHKEYPDPNDPETMKLRKRGISSFQNRYQGKEYPAILAGREMYARPQIGTYATTNPNTGVLIGSFQHYDPMRMPIQELMPKVFGAGQRFYERTSVAKRVELCFNIHQVVKETFWKRCAAKMRECGQSISEQIGETDEAVDFPLFVGLYLQELHEEKLTPTPLFAGDANGKAFVPHGVFEDIEPFNFPDAIPICMATMALAMGNAVVLKSSGYASLNGFLVYETLCEAFERTGIPHEGVINYMPGPGAVMADALLESPHVAGFSFTGSTQAHEEIMEKHGKALRYMYGGRARLVAGAAETSGVNPFVVWGDADPAVAATEYVKSFVGRSGQKCSSARVALVHKDIYEGFVEAVRTRLGDLRFGDVEEDGVDLGAVISEEAAQRIYEKIAMLLEEDVADLAYTGHIPSSVRQSPQNVPPMLLEAHSSVLKPESCRLREILMNTEIFGPVSTVIKVNDIYDVHSLLVESRFALTGSVFTDDLGVAEHLLRILPAGNKYLNRKCTGALVDCESFGGLLSASSPHGMKGKYALLRYGSMPVISARFNGLSENTISLARNMFSRLHCTMTRQ